MKRVFFCVALALATGQVVVAGEAADLEKENAALKDRVAKLEAALVRIESQMGTVPAADAVQKENRELKARVEKLEQSVAASAAVASQPAAGVMPAGAVAAGAPAQGAQGAAAPQSTGAQIKNFVETKYGVKMYGYLKLDMSYDDSRVTQGNYALYAASEQTNNDDDEFNMTARQSRLGMIFDGPANDRLKTGGRVEVDFYGDGAENKPELMLRRAYADLTWTAYDFRILGGQEWDVFSPVSPMRINYLPQGFAGDLGYRRPQLRAEKGFELGGGKLLTQTAVARTIGGVTGFDPGDTGEDAGMPSFQGRVSYARKLWAKDPFVIGISGEYGEEEYDLDATGRHTDFDTWGGCIDLTLPINGKLSLVGEVYTGTNLNQYLGGLGYGVNAARMRTVDADGGFLAFAYKLNEKWSFNTGWGMDRADEDDLSNGNRSENDSLFVNAYYQVNKAMTLGFEVSEYETDYVNLDEGDATRYQATMMYAF